MVKDAATIMTRIQNIILPVHTLARRSQGVVKSGENVSRPIVNAAKRDTRSRNSGSGCIINVSP